MYYYVPFSRNLTQGNTEDIATADPGHLVGVLLRFKSGSQGFHPLWGQISISNIGTTKEYLLKNGISAIFQRGTDGFMLNHWYQPAFIPLDHDIRTSHKVLLETYTWGAQFISVRGYFVYSK